MSRPTPPGRVTVAFVLVTYRPDEPAGMERATAALAAGLRKLGHRALILTAATQPTSDPNVITLDSLPVAFPCPDDALRATIAHCRPALRAELRWLLDAHHADAVVYVDALWGLGAVSCDHPARRVLAIHVVGHDQDLRRALRQADVVIAPSSSVLAEATAAGHDSTAWTVVPNSLLPGSAAPADLDPVHREALRRCGPVRSLARLGSEKGIAGLLAAAPRGSRPVEVALAAAGFETVAGGQADLAAQCRRLAAATGVALRPALGWQQVPAFLAGAAVTAVPSHRETFGLVALESMSVGTPVAGYAVGNLPALVGSGGILAPPETRPRGVWAAVAELVDDPQRYASACAAGYARSRQYQPVAVAEAFLEAVW